MDAAPPRRFDNDERLIAAVRLGSDEAFRMLYDRHHPAVRGLCRRMLGSDEADDAVQHAFTAAYVDIVRSPKPLQFRPWMLTIARHRCLTVLASRRPASAYAGQEPAGPTLAGDVEFREDLQAVLDDIAQLPEHQRIALVMRELAGASYAEIAERLDTPPTRGRSLVFQARSWLRSSREARAIPCAEIRGLLASSRGATLRRSDLRHHLRQCEGCRAIAADLRGRVGLLLPLGPLAALKRAALGAVCTSGGGGGVALLDGVAVKVLVSIAIAGGGGVAGMAASSRSQAAPHAAVLAASGPSGGIDHSPARASGQARSGGAAPVRTVRVRTRRRAVATSPASVPLPAASAAPTQSAPAAAPAAPHPAAGGGKPPSGAPPGQSQSSAPKGNAPPPGEAVARSHRAAAAAPAHPTGPPLNGRGPAPAQPRPPGPPVIEGGTPPRTPPPGLPGQGGGTGGPPVHGPHAP
jgi:RNA polymerase sigma factor (sigma-70 family)